MVTKANLPEVPAALADVALVDGPTAAAAGSMCLTAWLGLVRVGKAPQPVVRANRCTRWRLADVRAFLIDRAKQATANPAAGEALKARAKKASAEARAKRAVGSRP